VEEPFLNLNAAHLRQFDADLYRQLVNYPQEVRTANAETVGTENVDPRIPYRAHGRINFLYWRLI
jgi:hypothetical protein